MKKNRILSICLCMLMAVNILGGNGTVYAKAKNANNKKFCKNKLIFDDLDLSEKKKIKAAKEAVLDDCMLAGSHHNEI